MNKKITDKKLILIELNEINFDVVEYYLSKGAVLEGFQMLLDRGVIVTKSELEYDNLEPWIQWPSVHTGKTFEEHNIFRLGDFVNSPDEQFFEKIENMGFSVGAVSPMNASNKLKDPAYFIPDPWTQTPSDKSFLSKTLTSALIQTINDNSQSKLTFKSIISLSLAFIFLVNYKRYFSMIRYAFSAKGKRWRKALFLDMLLYEMHKTLFKRKKPDFSTLFLNAGAHIQHHYFYNSSYVRSQMLKNPSWYIDEDSDPFLEMLEVYDQMLIDLLSQKDTEVIIATGLSQKPFEELKFYYRLKNHAQFLQKIGINFNDVVPRMTRDFLISFNSIDQAFIAEEKLSKILVNNKSKLFEEIDNRGKDIFITLTYPHEIDDKTFISYEGVVLPLHDLVTFVAIKNGEHQGKGFAFFSRNVSKFAPSNESHISEIHNTILNFFGEKID